MPELADVVVVGGGLMGAALTFELARRSLRVALLEARTLGSGATGGSFAWINATSKADDEEYHRLNAAALAHYGALAAEVGAPTMGWHGGGALAWSDDSEGLRALRARAARLNRWNYPVVPLSREEILALEPGIALGQTAEGVFAPADGWIEPLRLMRLLSDLARERGARIQTDCPATGFTADVLGSISTVETPTGRIATRLLVIAAGLQTTALVDRLLGDRRTPSNVRVEPRPGLLVETPAIESPALPRRVLFPPDPDGLHVRPTPEGGMLIGADDTDAAVAGGADPRSYVGPLLDRLSRSIPGVNAATVRSAALPRICVRPMPFDGRPIVGLLPEIRGAYVAVTHSGLTLAPYLAHLLVDEIATGSPSPALAAYRPGRPPFHLS